MTTETAHGRPIETSVCVATFRRPEGLSRLLRSLEVQQGEVPSFEVIVVDNDDEGSAAAICETFKSRLGKPREGQVPMITGSRLKIVAHVEPQFSPSATGRR